MAESGAEPTLVLEELEIDEEPAWTAESDDAAVDAPAEPEAKSQEPQPNQAPAAPAGEASADQTPDAPEQPQAADDPTGKETN